MSFYHRGPRIDPVIDTLKKQILQIQHKLAQKLGDFYDELDVSDIVLDMEDFGEMKKRVNDKFRGFIALGKRDITIAPSDVLKSSKLANLIRCENRNMVDIDHKFLAISKSLRDKIDSVEAQIKKVKDVRAIKLAEVRTKQSSLHAKIQKGKNRLSLLYFVGNTFSKAFIKSQWKSGRLCSFLNQSSKNMRGLLNRRPDTSVGECIVAVQLSGGNIGPDTTTKRGEITIDISIKKVDFSKVRAYVKEVISWQEQLVDLNLKECEAGGCVYSCPGGCQLCHHRHQR